MAKQHPPLPEEILREILSYVLLVSPEDFFRFGPADPLSRSAPLRETLHRNPQLLLVSKTWLRVGTPLLYESLELSETKHTSAVAKLLREQPDVGSAVRCLRLEGGLTKDLVHIAKHAPNIRGLFMSLWINSSQTIAGLEDTLPLLSPTDLYVELGILFTDTYRSEKADEAKKLLFTHVSDTWATLRTVTLSPLGWLASTLDIRTALLNSSMEEIRCEFLDITILISRGTMKTILEIGRVTRVICFGDPAEAAAAIRKGLDRHGLSEHFHKFMFSPSSIHSIAVRKAPFA